MKPHCALTVPLALCVLTGSVPALAQAGTEGFALNRFTPSEQGSAWFVGESLDFSGHMRPTLGVVGDWAHRPLVLYLKEQAADVVSNQVHAHIGASLIAWDRVQLAVNAPIAVVNTGNSGTIGPVTYRTSSGQSLGDLRIGAAMRLHGDADGAFRAAAGLQLHLPTGSRQRYTGDEQPRVLPRLLFAGEIGGFSYAAHGGVNFRLRNENYLQSAFGTELAFGLAAGARLLGRRLTMGPELFGSTVVSDHGDGFLHKLSSPLELLLGGHYRFDSSWRVGVAGGVGLTRAYGTPARRFVASVEWSPSTVQTVAPPLTDQDGDDIPDQQDACPEQPGPASSRVELHGCPGPQDRDRDGVTDHRDACPDEAGRPNAVPERNGCPIVQDRDDDGFPDDQDACPDAPGVTAPDPSKNGCPPSADRDGDGVTNDADACPDEAGGPDADPANNGCPKARMVGDLIRITERIDFENGNARISPTSLAILNAVYELLSTHAEIRMVSVEGHTDSSGRRAFNLALSRRRAAAVVAWLVERGLDQSRFTTVGYGPDRPIAPNETPRGRRTNRRVEFIIAERTRDGS